MRLLIFGDMQDHAKFIDLCLIFAYLRLAAERGVGSFPHRDERFVFVRVAYLNGDIFILDELSYLSEDIFLALGLRLRLVLAISG